MTKEPPRPALSTYDLEMQGTPEYQAKMMAALRVVVAAMADSSVPFTHEAVAEATGLTPSTVAEALRSDECREMLTQACTERCQAILYKGMSVAEEIMIGQYKPEQKLAAFRSLTQLYRTLTHGEVKQESGAAEHEIFKMLKDLKTPSATVRVITEGKP